jgi:hypothetical protein
MARDGRSLGQVVTESLASPEYAHFCQPNSRGGTPTMGANRPAPNRTAVPVPKNLGEAVVIRWQEAAAQRSHEILGPIGLGRRR